MRYRGFWQERVFLHSASALAAPSEEFRWSFLCFYERLALGAGAATVREATAVSPLALLLFAGGALRAHGGRLAVGAGFVAFRADEAVAATVRAVRAALADLLADRLAGGAGAAAAPVLDAVARLVREG